jgi:integrase
MIKQRGKKGIWWIELRIQGKRVRVSSETTVKADALRIEAEYIAGVRLPAFLEVKVAGCTLERAHTEAMREHWADQKSAYTHDLNGRLVMAILGPDTDVKAIDEDKVRWLVSVLKSKNNSNGTINRKLAYLSKLLGLCRQWKYIKHVPYIPHMRESQGRIRILTEVEEAKVLGWFVGKGLTEMAALTQVLLDTGCRLSEVLNLAPSSVNHQDGLIHIWENKADHPRSVPMLPRTHTLLEGFTGWKVSKDQAEKLWQHMRRSIGLEADEQFVMHALRHTCCTRLLRAGVSLPVVQVWMGHKVVTTTMKYAHLADSDLMEAMQRVSKPVP